MNKSHVDTLLTQMTLEEKVKLCSGLNNWATKSLERLNIPSITISDGPNGLRKPKEEGNIFGESKEATCYPSPSSYASSWNRELIHKMGEFLGNEARTEEIDILLGPGINIKRSPLTGRNFEYLSEDPYLAGELATSYIQGVQSQGTGTALKHFAANNREYRRMAVDTLVDERTLREIYLPAFEKAVKQAKPVSVMSAYNKLNGEFASENYWLLTQLLVEEWKFDGFTISDWGAVDNRVKALKAGLAVEMPPSGTLSDQKIVNAVQEGILDESVLDKQVKIYLTALFKLLHDRKKIDTYDQQEHHEMAIQVALESITLLKNENNILPLSKSENIAIIGEMAENPRYRGGGSSKVNPTKLESPLNAFRQASGSDLIFAKGYEMDNDEINVGLVEEAINQSAKADKVVLFVGLTEEMESEGYDRTHLSLPNNQLHLIEELTKRNNKVIVILANGSPVEMPWEVNVKGILEGHLGGQGLASALTKIVYGDENPSGKLAETFPVRLEDTPSYLFFSGEPNQVMYREGIFVGYRYYDSKKMTPLYPFGFGLSYTSFSYESILVDKTSITDEEQLLVSVKVRNTGQKSGKEVVQLYVRDIESNVIRPLKELKGFEKISLQPNEAKNVDFELDKRAFAYFNTESSSWELESGTFEILVGSSSRDIYLQEIVEVVASENTLFVYDRNSTVSDVLASDEKREKMINLLNQLKSNNALLPNTERLDELLNPIVKDMPLRGLVIFSNGRYTDEQLDSFIKEISD
ncbi:glycoside hydrolase family 3 C-terminal domain-containing protein [Terribacillus saccharophilus]|uniref:glycoside hydrolase family 3 C-terminal domain-containing protein n=1 Tax=Terribacillus saccharophilus TaxID=361277 RepID=UPI003D271572